MSTFITNLADLQAMSVDLTEDYILLNDIDAGATNPSNPSWDSGGTWADRTGFNPISTFTGTFDGNGNSISNLFINKAANYIGLFGIIDSASSWVRNTNLIDVNITGVAYTGTLIGDLTDGTDVTNCSASGTLVTTGVFVGGLIGINRGANIVNCSVTTTVTGASNSVGGLIGNNYTGGTGNVTNCHYNGSITVTAGTYHGGLIGNWADGDITECSSKGTISGYTFVGGFVGFPVSAPGTAQRCFSSMDVTSSLNSTGGIYIGGFAGDSNGDFVGSEGEGGTAVLYSSDGINFYEYDATENLRIPDVKKINGNPVYYCHSFKYKSKYYMSYRDPEDWIWNINGFSKVKYSAFTWKSVENFVSR